MLSVEEEDDLLLVSKEGVIIRVSVSDIPVYSRSAGGVIVMRMSGNNKVVNCTVVKKEEAAPEGGESHPDAAGQTPAGETEEAEDKAWKRFGSDSCAFQEIWKADEDGESFTVYYNN